MAQKPSDYDCLERSAVTAYGTMVREIRDDIIHGKLSLGDRLAGEFELSDKYGISRWSVRKALELLAENHLVSKIPGKGTVVTFNPELINREDAETPHMVVLVDTPPSFQHNFYAMEIIRDLKYSVQEARSHIELEFRFINFAEEVQVPLERKSSNTIFVVLPFSRQCNSYLDTYYQSDDRVFCFGRRLNNPNLRHIYIDHADGIQKAVEYLLHLGHRRIGMIAPLSFPGSYSEVRQQAFRKALSEAGATPVIAEAEYNSEVIHNTIAEMTADPATRPTALIIADGVWFSLVERALSLLSIKIPEELSLISCDDFPSIRAYCPAITIIRQPVDVAVGNMIKMITDKTWNKIPTYNPVRPELVVRDSCIPV